MKFRELEDKDVYVEGAKIGKVKDVQIDPEEWKVTHLEVELTKETTKEVFGAKKAFRNMLAISALGKGAECCTDKGIELKVSKGQLNIYLRPTE
jgi:sporulation protein YlmC with PRC-barrel domain